VTAERRADGSWAFWMHPLAEPAFVLAAPYVIESAPPGQASPSAPGAVTLDVTEKDGRFLVDLTVDAAWLHAPERSFPLLIDPTITIQPSTEDVSIRANCSTCGTLVDDNLFVGGNSTYTYRAALTFDLGAVPQGAGVTDAQLRLYLGACLAAGNGTCGGIEHQLNAHRLTSPGRLRAVTALTLLSPGTPMLFMGQEFASSAPFHSS
jgi:hypothetical protein